jgi:ATP-dependent NAD(P)H-hydrate dehydratase
MFLMSKFLPRLVHALHKGQCGRVGVVGGSDEYTGAPYFCAMSALRTGADLAHVICTTSAALAIQSYSPDLIVHPYLDTPSKITPLLSRLHVLVIGPGLSRDPHILDTTAQIIHAAKKRDLSVIIDADGLFLVAKDPSLVHGCDRIVLTPNYNEFSRLCKSVDVDMDDGAVTTLAKQLGGVTIVSKGQVDIISNGVVTLTCTENGSPRRQGGQGDVLSGIMAAFVGWCDQASDIPEACRVACMVTRCCSRMTFDTFGRSMQTSDMLGYIGKAVSELEHV